MKITFRGIAFGERSTALHAFSKGYYKKAEDLLQKLLKKSPQDPLFLKVFAVCLIMEEDFRDAIETLNEAGSLAAKDPEIPNILALVHIKQGRTDTAIDTILNALDIMPNEPLLKKTLESIRKLNGAEHAKTVSVIPLITLNIPYPISLKKTLITTAIAFGILIGSTVLNYLAEQNSHRFTSAPMINDVTIKNIDKITDARENFRIALTDKEIVQKFNDLRSAISDNKPNTARILVNELLASNAGIQVKERVSVLGEFIGPPSIDNIDFVPRYADIAAAPVLYENIALRWNGTIIHVNNSSKQTTFNLLINFLGDNEVEGISAVELDDPPRGERYRNGQKVIVTGIFDGMTADNRVIIKAKRISPL